MREFEIETERKISKESFTQTAWALLNTAENPETTINEVLEAAERVKSHMDEVTDGSLKVVPEMADNDRDKIYEETHKILRIGNKAMAALQESTQAAQQSSSQYQGQGAGTKQ